MSSESESYFSDINSTEISISSDEDENIKEEIEYTDEKDEDIIRDFFSDKSSYDKYLENIPIDPRDSNFMPIDRKMYYASRAFIRYEGPVGTHINSYNYTVSTLIPAIVDSVGKAIVKYDGQTHKIILSSAFFGKPKHKENDESTILLNPKLCLDRKISYLAPLYVNITYYNPNGFVVEKQKKLIGEIPIEVLSVLCTLKPIAHDEKAMASLHEDVREVGGYFIIKGQQKVVIHQIRRASNQIFTFKGKTNTQGGPKFSVYAETRSCGSYTHLTTTKVGVLRKSLLMAFSIPYIENTIPIGIVFKALGVLDERKIANYIFPAEWYALPPSLIHKEMIEIVLRSLEQSYGCDTQDKALEFIGKSGQKFMSNKNRKSEKDTETDEQNKKLKELPISYSKHLLSNELLPHIGLGEDYNENKCFFLGLMIQKLLLTQFEIIPLTDRDHSMNKRLQTSGMLIAMQFHNAFRQLVTHIRECMEKNLKNNVPIVASSYITMPHTITSSLVSALTSNKWNINKNKADQTQGISHAIDSFNYCALLSCLRKFISPLKAEAGKIEKPRQLHCSQWGSACMYKTPEGKQVGLVLGFAMGSYISIGSDPEPIIEILKDLSIVQMKDIQVNSDFLRYTKVFVNGNPQGYTNYPEEVVSYLRVLRRSASIDMEVSILYDKFEKSINICTDAGRFGRAVAIAPNGVLKLTEKVLDEIKEGKWDDNESNAWIKLMECGYTEILFKDEEEEMNIAIFPSDLERMNPAIRCQYTHCELTPDMIEGAGVSTSPLNDHNQAPRNIYQESMSHQAIGTTSNAQFLRKGKNYYLEYPQKPLVSTRISRELGFSDMPMGQNVMICVAPFRGKNQEDSIILNEQAVNRGLFSTIVSIAYESTLSNPKSSNSARYESFEIPNPKECNDFNGNPDKLKIYPDGYVYAPVGTEVAKDDILIGVVINGAVENPMFNKNKTKINTSIKYDHKLPGIVHSVQTGCDGKGYKYIRVVVNQKRRPILGDKFCYTPNHEILTTEGWVNITQVTVNHKVASLKDNKELVYEYPTEVVSFPLEEGEKLIHVASHQVDLCVTANHNMYVKLENSDTFIKKEVQELFDTKVKYKKNAELFCGEETLYPNDIFLGSEWLKFYGIWLSQEYWKYENDRFIFTKSSKIDYLANVMDLLNYGYQRRDLELIVFDEYLNNLLLNFSKTHMENWVWVLSKEKCSILLSSIVCINNNPSVFYTFSEKLKDDIMRLALHAGYCANACAPLVKASNKTNIPSKSICSWMITINRSDCEPLVTNQKWVTPNCKFVYCCTVPSGLLYVRNKLGDVQKPVWSGNSGVHGQKGTAGALVKVTELPFLKKRGWTPDLLINPLAFPSRMTIGMLLEMIMGCALTSTALQTDDFDKPLCLDDPSQTGCITTMTKKWKYPEGFDPEKDYEHLNPDGTPWDKSFSIHTFFDALKKVGINEYAEEIVIDPVTGEELSWPIFSTVVFYQRLKHMTVDKIHARARGTRHGLHRQPTEGRKKGGGFRVGHMERDAVPGSVLVSLREGISIRMDSLSEFEKVWGWNDIEKGLEKSEQINFIPYEVQKEIVIVTLQDGRVIKSSKCHPYLVQSDGKYVEVKDLVCGDKLACSVIGPEVDFDDDMILCENFEWTSKLFSVIHTDGVTPDDKETLRRQLCLARLVGLSITDGHATRKSSNVSVFTGHSIDELSLSDDIFRLTGYRPKSVFKESKFGSAFVTQLPDRLSRLIRELGIIKGAKVKSVCLFPDFINLDTPQPILREFLGGLFGGDGHTVSLSKHREKRDLMKSVSISWTRDQANLESLIETWQLLQKILLERFQIQSTIQEPKLTTNSKYTNDTGGEKYHYEVVLSIKLSDIISFHDQIGFRYCEHKSMRLEAGVSYRRFREGVLRQRKWIVERINELSNYREIKSKNPKTVVRTKKFMDQAVKELKEKEALLHEHSIPDRKTLERLLGNRMNNELRSSTFPTVEDYFNEIDAINMFYGAEDGKVNYGISRDNEVVPVYWLKIIDIKYTGEKEFMYDITVNDTESYLTNGVVSHNCMLSQGTPHMVNDRLFHQSDAHQMVVCSICGIQATDNGRGPVCRLCGTNECVLVDIPYGTKLMSDEFQVMNFVPRIITRPITK